MRRITCGIASATLCITTVCGAQGTTWSAGAAVGSLRFSSGATESALGATVAARMMNWFDVSANPTYAWTQTVAVQATPSTLIPGRKVTGFTDLPVNVGISHSLPGAWSPSFSVSLGVTLPTGDTAGLGSGHTAVGGSASLGLSPTDDQWLSVGAGRSLSNGYSASLASSTSTSVSLSGGTRAGLLQLSAGISGDVGTVPAGYEAARSLAAGVAIPTGAGMSLSLDGSVGLSKGSPDWAITAAFGTTPAGIVAATAAPFQRLNKAFGSGSSTSKIKGKTKP